MQLPVIEGVVARRILVNYRVDPRALSDVLPDRFRPQLVNGFGIAGVCLIRLEQIRPQRWPAALGISSENAAHRIAVEWNADGQIRRGVYIPRRDTGSRLNALLGGRFFPGAHHAARFNVRDADGTLAVDVRSRDGSMNLSFAGRRAETLPPQSVFATVGAAANFFRCGSLGYSPAREPNHFEGLSLELADWEMTPMAVDHFRSSFFEQRGLFAPGTVELDSALLMEHVEHRWLDGGLLYSDAADFC